MEFYYMKQTDSWASRVEVGKEDQSPSLPATLGAPPQPPPPPSSAGPQGLVPETKV